jgi:hypothetical protein
MTSRFCCHVASALAVVIGGCASTGLDGNVFHGDGFAFRVVAPTGSWKPLEASHAALAYRNDASHATILINARCNLDGDDIPLQSLTQHLFLQFTERDIKTQEVVPFDGREAMHTIMDAKLDGIPMSYDVWVMKKDGCVYDLLYVAPPATFGGERSSFDDLVRGFATVGAP